MVGKEPPRRKPQRIDGFDYAQPGTYFVTICTTNRVCSFGRVHDGVVELSPAGCEVSAAWQALPERFPSIELDAFVVMPNHVHGIVSIRAPGGPSLGQVMRAFKSLSAERMRAMRGLADRAMWQPGY